MKKILFIMFICLLLISNYVVYAENQIEVEIWHTWNVEEGGTEHELQVIVDEYNALHDDVIIKLISQPSSGFANKVYTSTANGIGPDIYFNFANTLPEYVEEGLAADMGKYIDIETLHNRIPESLYEECINVSDGLLHIIPIQSTVSVIFYNKTIYDELGLTPPKTWADVEANARAIYEKKDIPGFAADSYTDLGQTLFYQAGAVYIDADAKKVGFNTPECVDQLKWYDDCINEGIFTSNFETGSIDQDFNAGLLASFIGTCSYEPYIVPNGFDYGVVPVVGNGENNGSPIFSRGAIVLASDEKTEAAACDFLNFFTDQEHTARWGAAIGGLSPYKDAENEPLYTEHIENSIVLQAAIISMENAFTTPAVVGAQTIRTEIKQAFLQVIGGLLTPEESLAQAEANCNAALNGK